MHNHPCISRRVGVYEMSMVQGSMQVSRNDMSEELTALERFAVRRCHWKSIKCEEGSARAEGGRYAYMLRRILL